MSVTFSVVSSCLLVLVLLIGEYLCLLNGPAIKIGDNVANKTNSRQQSTGHIQDWQEVGQTRFQAANNFRSNSNGNFYPHNSSGSPRRAINHSRDFRLGGGEWPVVGQRRQIINWSNNQNYNINLEDSFGPIRRENSHMNGNVSFADSLRNSNARSGNVGQHNITLRTSNNSFTGIKFGDHNNHEVLNNQQSSPHKRTDTNAVTDNELREFSEQLLLKDKNNAAKYVTINFQGRTTSRSTNDEAPLPLLYINRDVYNVPTIAKLIPLYDNYILQSNIHEDYTNQEREEENALLRAVLNTDVMKATKNFLIGKGSIKNDREFENLLRDIWFYHYSRGKRIVGSSGFEHVFLAEIKKNEVSGLHNWLYFEREETNQRANYLGFLKKIDLGGKGAILKYSFDFHGINKPVGGMFIGTSPEFEMALYSTCFILRADRICPLKLNGHRFIIRTFTYRYDGKNLIGSAFPDI